MYSDFVAFVDGGSIVPYFMDDCVYIPTPALITFKFEYDFKIYYKSYNRYFVGIHCSKTVREIHAGDFKRVFALYEDRNKEKLSTRFQQVFDF
ncbi:MAG: hypothetical protein GW906_06245 [Epsilonproteobacteria bacterium]|nr:hypothetical protein [Campylobacterota bacterium]OIO15016.1 MAG: hypothetical protein AUJ81_08160 [Helicobacteraceae bacterium CG1_02_36_14]PIP10527.1 MAG: hypothetical protein COX50_05365 [Sulfurimonas sp. CG23_combo_of_CG06-09_8_20_14_all_36_33]PIS26977.1 MAG: hypothetical protein COT46_00640 [Sulfurimonas sp. CG08_land_8_20_14_0_20_36_33]PIU35871.1 MAG: hypothetical protein COT05_01615 [Sulfurimonas sp. CG07_land_8_20_14_0_80_36_56]PIV03448.1 MAG: hypothetical protein COS56_08470 [Sulfur